MQRLTTREPDEKQLEIAITALKLALIEEFPDLDTNAFISFADAAKAASTATPPKEDPAAPTEDTAV
jgi:hypothetical protein